MTHDERRNQILDECLTAVLDGRLSIAECVARYPAYQQELEELLPLATQLSHLPAVTPSAEFRARSPQRLMARLAAAPVPIPPPAPTPAPSWWTNWRSWLGERQTVTWSMASAAVALVILVLVWQTRPSPDPVIVIPTVIPVAVLPTDTTAPPTAEPAPPTAEPAQPLAEQLATQIAQANTQLAQASTAADPAEAEANYRTSLEQLTAAQTTLATAETLATPEQLTLATILDAQWQSYQMALLSDAPNLAPAAVQGLATELQAAQQTYQTLALAQADTPVDEASLRLLWASRALSTAVAWAEQGQLDLASAAIQEYTAHWQSWQALPSTIAMETQAAAELAVQQPLLAQLAAYPALSSAAVAVWEATAAQLIEQTPPATEVLRPTETPTAIPPPRNQYGRAPHGRTGGHPHPTGQQRQRPRPRW